MSTSALLAKINKRLGNKAKEEDRRQFPLLRWSYGNPDSEGESVNAAGGWFILLSDIPTNFMDKGENYLPDMLKENGFVDGERRFSTGNIEPCLWATEIEFIRLGEPRYRYTAKVNGQPKSFTGQGSKDRASAASDEGYGKLNQQQLVLLKGVERITPFTLTLSGSGSFAWDGVMSEKGITGPKMGHRLAAQAAIAAVDGGWSGASMSSVYTRAGVMRDDKGKVIFTVSGKVTGKTRNLSLPEFLDGLADYPLEDRLISENTADIVALATERNEKWFSQWRSNTVSDDTDADDETEEVAEEELEEELV